MNLKDVADYPIRKLRRRSLVCVSTATPLLEVVDLMHDKKRGAIAVVDSEGVMVGIFSIRDLMRRVDHTNTRWHSLPVSEVMTPRPVCVAEDESLSVALELMEEGGFRHLPRVDERGRPTAILSVRDVLVYISECFPKEFLNLPVDPTNTATQPWGG